MTETTLPSRLRQSTINRTAIFSILLGTLIATPAFAHQTHAGETSLDTFQNTSMVDQFQASPLGDAPAMFDMSATPAAAPLNSAQLGHVQKLLERAMTLLGIPYRWGGTSTSGFDCSGLVGYVFRTALGIDLPRVSREIATRGTLVGRDQLAEGDLVFFGRGRGGHIDHVGIYIGNGEFVHAPRTGRDVSVSKLDGYWSAHLVTARRISG